MTELSFEEVSYSYPGPRSPALDGVCLRIEPGEFCVLAGGSGSGKSTLLRAACGLVPHFHGGTFAGRARVGGLDTRAHGPERIATVAGTLFQDPETQIVMAGVRAELAFPLENRGHGAAAVARGVEEVALALGIEGLLERATAELSAGELQRVALGAALAGRPRLVLLDEPTSQLDPVAGDELMGLLRRLNQEWGTAVLLVEHRLERCLAVADRVLAMDRGRLAYDGPPSGFLSWAQRCAVDLMTPGARMFAQAGLTPAPVGVKQARATLRDHGLSLVDAPGTAASPARRRRGRRAGAPALKLSGVWDELRDGPALLRGVDLELEPGERVALMGRNGAGKSTLLRNARGLRQPTRGRVRTAGRVALLLQNPGDYLIHDRVVEDCAIDVLRAAGLADLAERHPRDLSGGERQRVALAVVAAPAPPVGEIPALVALDEPTRGMDRAWKSALIDELISHAGAGSAVIVATHDVEFAAEFAQRVVLLADGRVIADGPPQEILAGGWYFATETSRILDGAAGALLPGDGAGLLKARMAGRAPDGAPVLRA